MDSLITLLTALLGCSTLVGWMLYRKSEKRTKDAEAASAEANAKLSQLQVKMKQIDIDAAADNRFNNQLKVLHDNIDVLNRQLNDALKDKERAQQIIDSKTERIRAISDQLADTQARLIEREESVGRLRLFIQWLRNWHCRRETGHAKGQCTRRVPEQKTRLRYEEFPDCELAASFDPIPADDESSPENN